MKYYKIKSNDDIDNIIQQNLNNKKIAVIVHIEDKNGKILLQQRGKKARDDNGLYEYVAGSVKTDENYKSAMIREIKEEMGDNAIIDISDPIAVYHVYKENINWLFVIFYGKYIEGEIKIMEPDKCINYKFFTYEEIINSNLVTKHCQYLTKSIINSSI